MTTQALDSAKVEAFGGRMLGMLNDAFLTQLVSIGHQTGLFDRLAELPPSTSEQIAEASGLNERYVREWLAATVVGRIVEYDPAARAYWLPPEHAASLTRAAGPNNVAFFTQYLALVGQNESRYVECFRSGGGVPYSAFGRFQELQREETAPLFDATLIDVTLPLIPGMVERLQRGIDVAEIGCGSGHALNLMASSFPNSRLTGYDFSEEGLAAGRKEAESLGLANIRFVLQDVAALEHERAYDLITAFDTIHDQARPGRVLQNVARSLRPGGTFLMVDIAASSNLEENLEHPLAPMLYSASVLHCMTVSLAQGGEGLGTMWGEQTARRMLAEAGFARVETKQVEGDFMNVYYICSTG